MTAAGTPPATAIRPAATLVLLRRPSPSDPAPSDPAGEEPRVLMGQRGSKAAFMPAKFVFPGGAIDPGDDWPAPLPLSADDLARLPAAPAAPAILGAALRELEEESGLRLDPAQLQQNPLRFIFRAITPPGLSRRFDVCFFLADAGTIAGDAEDFSAASGELSHLQWIGLGAARGLDLPFITRVVLAEVAHLARGGEQPGVPFFDNSGPRPAYRRL